MKLLQLVRFLNRIQFLRLKYKMTKQRQIPISLGGFCECIWTVFWALNW
jgi:hypothetical protein